MTKAGTTTEAGELLMKNGMAIRYYGVDRAAKPLSGSLRLSTDGLDGCCGWALPAVALRLSPVVRVRE